jgi:tetratricopeptide (TPR) repeat protein
MEFVRNIFPVFLVLCLTSATLGFTEEESARQPIRQWVQQLGDESFLVRQRAETLLIRAGIQAYPELQRAKQSHDLEIVRHAEYVLSQIEQTFLELENQDTAFWIQSYMLALTLTDKVRYMWGLADPMSGLSRGEGQQTLCRLVRFEESTPLRLEAVKTLIASPPLAPTLRQRWYRHIRDNFNESDDDELHQCLAHYANLWWTLDIADEKTTASFQKQVRQVGTETLRLLERPENTIYVGSSIDILLHYAVAELQDAAGLIEDRDKTAALALAVQPQPVKLPEIPIGDVNSNLLMFEHFHVGQYLLERFRLHWASVHFQKVMERGDVFLRRLASEKVVAIALDHFADYSLANAFCDKHLEILDSTEYRATGNDPAQPIAQGQRRKTYCLAAKAAAEENWDEVREAIMKAWSTAHLPWDPTDMGILILAYQLCKRQPGIDREFKEKMDSVHKQLWQRMVQNYEHLVSEDRLIAMPSTCNSAAWLLAHTDGDYTSALTLVESALEVTPDDPGILDTLAHVYFFGGKIEEAIRTQEQVVRMAPESVVFRQALERFQQAKTP